MNRNRMTMILAFGLALAACGGDDTSGGTTSGETRDSTGQNAAGTSGEDESDSGASDILSESCSEVVCPTLLRIATDLGCPPADPSQCKCLDACESEAIAYIVDCVAQDTSQCICDTGLNCEGTVSCVSEFDAFDACIRRQTEE